MADIRIKRGASLNLTMAFANADGTAFALDGVSLSGAVATPQGELVAVLAPVYGGVGAYPGIATVSVPNTANWPEGLLEADIVVVSASGAQALSQSFGIRVERPVTQLAPEPARYDPITAPSSAIGGG